MKIIPTLLDMEICIAKMFDSRQNIIVPNISWGFGVHECDLLIIKPSGYAIEVEIKRSKSDLLADKKKGHNHESTKISELYYALPECLMDSCMEHIPLTAGVISVKYYESRSWWSAAIIRPAMTHKRTKLTDEQIQKVSRLGVMRIWTLKSTLVSLMKDNKALKEKLMDTITKP